MTKQEWVDYYKKKYPNRSDSEINKLADEQVKLQANPVLETGTGIVFGGGTGSSSNKNGIRIGFGLVDANGDALVIQPGRLPSYMQGLLLKDPTAYTKVQNLVYQASGKKYSDPDALGTWLQTVAMNLQSSIAQDPTLKNSNVESVVNAAIANRLNNPLFAKAESAKNVPTRQIYKKTDAEIESDINDQAQKVLGRAITPADMEQKWYKDLRKGISGLYSQGIVTKTEKVKNPKTGKVENRVVQVPQYSQEQVTSKITSTLQEADPEAVARNERIGFTKFLFGMGGQQG